MPSILPQINALQDVPLFNFKYCEFLLDLILSKLLAMGTYNIGEFYENDEQGSFIGFDDDDNENVQLHLRYSEGRFIIVVNENSIENFACTFQYKIFDDSPLFYKIPDKLRAALEEAAEKF